MTIRELSMRICIVTRNFDCAPELERFLMVECHTYSPFRQVKRELIPLMAKKAEGELMRIAAAQ